MTAHMALLGVLQTHSATAGVSYGWIIIERTRRISDIILILGTCNSETENAAQE
jgi:hypothetical protein